MSDGTLHPDDLCRHMSKLTTGMGLDAPWNAIRAHDAAQRATLAAQAAEIAELKLDRERLDWIDRNWRIALTSFDDRVNVLDDGVPLRAAIDAARAKAQP